MSSTNEEEARKILKKLGRSPELIEAIIDYSRLAKALQGGKIDKIIKELEEKYEQKTNKGNSS